jgi:hypothetical protein
MQLPVQAPAVVRGSVSWTTSRPDCRSLASGVEPAAGSPVKCKGTTPYPCLCDNGIATCCRNDAGCTVSTTGSCMCIGRGR